MMIISKYMDIYICKYIYIFISNLAVRMVKKKPKIKREDQMRRKEGRY